MQTILIFTMLLLFFFFTKNLLAVLFSLENYNIHKRRLKQLQFQNKKNVDLNELIDSFTKPVRRYILPKLKPKDLDQLTKDLVMAKWDKNFTAIQYRALSITLKIIGFVMFLLFYKVSVFIAVIWGVALIFGIDILFKNSLSERRKKLLSDFPDFIRITEGYLSANIPFAQAVSESIKYVGDEWKPILLKFVVECNVSSIEDALDTLKNTVDLYAVREFVALVKLVLEQGGDARESFSAQADKMREMQADIVALKVGQRQMMGIIIQAPLLLCNIMVLALPTVSAMMNFSSI